MFQSIIDILFSNDAKPVWNAQMKSNHCPCTVHCSPQMESPHSPVHAPCGLNIKSRSRQSPPTPEDLLRKGDFKSGTEPSFHQSCLKTPDEISWTGPSQWPLSHTGISDGNRIVLCCSPGENLTTPRQFFQVSQLKGKPGRTRSGTMR